MRKTTYRLERNNKSYEMGLSVKEVRPGDVVKTVTGRLETIVNVIGDDRHWSVETEEGGCLSMWSIGAYGRRID